MQTICDIVLGHLQTLNNSLPPEGPGSAEAALRNKTRNFAFTLEGIARALADQDSYYEALDNKTKVIEDALGKYSLHGELLQAATQAAELSAKTKSPKDIVFTPQFLDYLKRRQQKGAEDLEEAMKEDQWLQSTNSRAMKLIKQLKEVDPGSSMSDRIMVLKATQKYFAKLKKHISKLKELIAHDEYDFQDLEEGLHEFRRVLRWVPILLQGLQPYFSIETYRGSDQGIKDLIAHYKDNPYSKLDPKTDLTFGIPEAAFVQFTYLIEKVGDIKSRGEAEYYLTRRYHRYLRDVRAVKITKPAARRAVREELGAMSAVGVETEAHALFAYYEKYDPIQAVIDALAEAERRETAKAR